MRRRPVTVGLVPLVDCAPLVIAQEMGFAAEEGLELALRRATSWSTLRDLLSFGQVDAAHMLAPVPVAMALGLGGGGGSLAAVSVLSVNGTVVGVSRALAARMRAAGHPFDLADATAAGRALLNAGGPALRIGVPFPFSMQAELVTYWLEALDGDTARLRTVPPALMSEALGAGEIDAFCVGEPWGSRAVETGVGELLLPGAAIWSAAPEKVLALRTETLEDDPDLTSSLIRAVWRAGRWLGDPAARSLAAEILARPEHLGIEADLIERALSGRLVVAPDGTTRAVDRFVVFHEGASAFPWRSQAAWIGARLAARAGFDPARAATVAEATFRSDVFRRALAPLGEGLPAASSRVEGASAPGAEAPGTRGPLPLLRNAFFDGRTFAPFAGRPEIGQG